MYASIFGESTFRANILESLTTGMYHDSKVIYREYIQNACDSIDTAVHEGVLKSIKDGVIEIWVDIPNRTVTIEDNGAGILASDFQQMLTTIGGSPKQYDEHKGFRGMGRLCGLGYCTTLVFTSTAKGEPVESVLTCDAVKMREMINAHNTHIQDYSAVEVLNETTTISSHPTENVDVHYFRVELIGISLSNKDLLDKKQVMDYLTFVAPVPYRNTFAPRQSIYNEARKLGVSIDEYSILFEGEAIYKDYKPTIITSKGADIIKNVEFYAFRDGDGKLIAWLWFGITKFQAMLKKECKERGIRLRKENIQIGDEDALQKLFNEDRGQHYFVGEVFAVDKQLIPNSQRSYFNENNSRAEFERLLKQYFNGTLSRIYKDGSTVNAAIADISKASILAEQIAETEAKGNQVDQKLQEQFETARLKAERKKKDLSKISEQITRKIDSGDFQPADAIIHNIIGQVSQPSIPSSFPVSPPAKPPAQTPQSKAAPSALSTMPAPQRLVSLDTVREIIRRYASEELAAILIRRIEEET